MHSRPLCSMAEAARSPDVLELKIKTLDAQEFAVLVNKNVSSHSDFEAPLFSLLQALQGGSSA